MFNNIDGLDTLPSTVASQLTLRVIWLHNFKCALILTFALPPGCFCFTFAPGSWDVFVDGATRFLFFLFFFSKGRFYLGIQEQ